MILIFFMCLNYCAINVCSLEKICQMKTLLNVITFLRDNQYTHFST